jgi:hypothetical protein
MLRTSILCSLLVTSSSLFCQPDKECRSDIELDVVFEKIEFAADTAARVKPVKDTALITGQGITPSGITCGIRDAWYRLRILNDAFTVISFTITVETEEGDIAEVVNEGENLKIHSQVIIGYRKKNEPIYLSCIKARHTSGAIRILKPLSVKTYVL